MTLADVRRLVEELADELTGLDRARALVALQAIDVVQARAGQAQDTLAELRGLLLEQQQVLESIRTGRVLR